MSEARNDILMTKSAEKMAFGPLIVLATALFIIIIDTTLLNVSLRAIITDLNSNIQQIQWVITVYSLMLAALTITGGRLGDIFGRKRMFLIGAVIFAIGSAMAAASHSFGMLLAGEAIIEGLGAALMMPATASLLLVNYQGRQRAIAFGVWGGMAGAASAIGPILGGYLTTNYTWRYGFLINVFVVAALLFAAKVIQDKSERNEKLTIDWGGVALSSLSLLSLVFGLIEASSYGWWTKTKDFVVGSLSLQPGNLSITPVAIAIGIVGLIAFYFWERHVDAQGRTPLLTLDLFKNKPFMAGTSTLFMVSVALSGFVFLTPVFYQAVLGLDALHSGLANLPLSIALLIVAPLGAIFSKKISPKLLIIVGMLVTAVSMYTLGRTFAVDATPVQFLPSLALFGIGMGLVQSQINNLALSTVPLNESGEAAGLSQTFRQLGSTFGSAILGSVLLATIPFNMQQGVAVSTVLPDAAKPAITEQLVNSGSAVEFAPPSTSAGSQNPVIGAEVRRIVSQAITDADRHATTVATLFVLAGVVVALWLPKKIASQRPGAEMATAGH